ncbi:MAG: hypothetical protein JNK82_04235, partial [Myxococcaceae bacterium]|nr:hypothetical protein [Myxococcaceae bacterium]
GGKKDAADIQSLIERATPSMLKEARRALALIQERGTIADVRRADRDRVPVTGARRRRLRGR